MLLNKTENGIEKDIKEKLAFEPSVDETKIRITVNDGIVALFGAVGSYFEKTVAEQAVRRVEGVKGVVNELKVNLANKYQRSDMELAEAAIHAIQWDVAVPEDAIKVHVEDGHVILTGVVQWWYQRNAAEKAIRNLAGVKNIHNQITISPRITPKNIKKKIIEEFQRNASINAEKINVEVEGAKVILRGEVRSWLQSKEAVRAVWSISGITEVENELIIHIDN